MEQIRCEDCGTWFARPNALGRRPRVCPVGCPVDPVSAFRQAILEGWALDDRHLALLDQACDCLEEIIDTKTAVRSEGMYYTDRWGQPKRHPGVAELRALRTTFARLLREIGLAVEGDDTPELTIPRLPRIEVPVNAS